MSLFRKIRDLIIGLSIPLNILLLFLIMVGSMGGTVSNKAEDFWYYYFFLSLILIFVWFWISDKKEKYPKTELIANSIIAIILMAPWFTFAIRLIF